MNTFLAPLDLLISFGSVRGQVPGKQTLLILTFLDGSFITGCSGEQHLQRLRKAEGKAKGEGEPQCNGGEASGDPTQSFGAGMILPSCSTLRQTV